MAQIFVPGLQLKAATTVRRIRDLPIPGQILVSVGDLVSGESVVGQALLPGDLTIVRVAEELGLPPGDVPELAKVSVGQTVTSGELIAEHVGLWGLLRAKVAASVPGVVESISERTGHITIREAAKPLNVSAYVAGRVVSVVPQRSVVIETQGAFLQGIFGVGGERVGKIRILSVAPEQKLTPADIPDDAKGQILIGGTAPTAETLAKVVAAGAVGLVCGAIDDAALRHYVGYDIGVAITGDEAVACTVIVTEGFGAMPIAARVLKLLQPLAGKVASINGATQVRAGAVRPEIIVPESAPVSNLEEQLPESGGGLHVGSKVRLIRMPYFGLLGTVAALPPQAQMLDTGAMARVLLATLADGQVVTVPRANVELVDYIES